MSEKGEGRSRSSGLPAAACTQPGNANDPLFDAARLGVRAFRYGRTTKVHAGKNIHGIDQPTPSHVRLWCGLSGSWDSQQFRVTETSGEITCHSCIRAMGLKAGQT